MKKLLLVLCAVLLICGTSISQVSEYDKYSPVLYTSLGLTTVAIDVGPSSNVGMSMSLNVYYVYFDVSWNGARGEGQRFEPMTGERGDSYNHYGFSGDKVLWYSMNIGVPIYFNNYQTWLTPTLGLVVSRGVYENNEPYTWYYGKPEGVVAVGLMVSHRVDSFVFSLGSGYPGIVEFSVGWVWSQLD
jgi:hypothetical protein